MIAKAINRKPRNEIVGPTTMRRVEKMSGSKPAAVVEGPSMSRKPTIIAAAAMAINIKLALTRGKRAGFSGSSCEFFFAIFSV